MHHAPVFGGILLVTLVVASGCASRGWVRQLEGTVGQHAQRLDATSNRVDGLGQRVDGLGQRIEEVDGRVGQLARHHHAANVVETMDVRFGFGRADLDDGAMTRLHALANELKGDARLGFELVGYADPSGPRDYNVQLSQRRVEAVRRYLVQQGVPVSRIAAIGLGEIEQRGIPHAARRRVLVNVTMTEATVMASTPVAQTDSPSPAPATQPQSQ
jgi:outer membrane protein OmpA-like peptidoglycan-associated protein